MSERARGVRLQVGDAFSLVDRLQDGSVQLTVTSPPYNMGKIYESRRPIEDYLHEYVPFAEALFRKTSTQGSVCWQVGNYVEKGEVFPLDILFYPIFKQAGFRLRNRIVWHFEHGLHARRRLSGRYETILWLTKSDSYRFELDSIRVPAKYPGKRHFKGARKGLLSGNPLGKNPSDYWRAAIVADWQELVWEIPNVKANHPEKTEHPCQFPVELVERLVVALTQPGDLVFDPFMGVGSSAIAAVKQQRDFIGFDAERRYVEIARRRLQQFRRGSLKLRPLGKPVYRPTGNEAVSRVPAEWAKQSDVS